MIHGINPYVQCMRCGLRTAPYKSRDDAVKSWNERPFEKSRDESLHNVIALLDKAHADRRGLKELAAGLYEDLIEGDECGSDWMVRKYGRTMHGFGISVGAEARPLIEDIVLLRKLEKQQREKYPLQADRYKEELDEVICLAHELGIDVPPYVEEPQVEYSDVGCTGAM